jgi:7-cyano-7-deazaguanine reductase
MEDKRKILEVFENKYPDRDYEVIHVTEEFTSLCPKTGHPDFAKITIRYIPDKLCVELKSLKLYFESYRNDGIYYESVTNKILDDLVAVTNPRYMKVTAEFNIRGGFASVVNVEYRKNK